GLARAAKNDPGHGGPGAEGERLAGHKEEREQAKEYQEAVEEEKSALAHVMDSYEIELFESFGPRAIHLPHREFHVGGLSFTLGLSKFMILEVVAAVLVALIYIPLARRLQTGEPPRGGWLNAFEVLLTFVRDEVAQPAIGPDADKYVPFLWTMFLFILFNNLLGLIPFCGSATGNIYVTLGLAICVFFAIHGSAAAKMGLGHYIGSMWPHIDVPFGMGYVLKPFIFAIEWLGVLVRNVVLAVRLFANMFAGHVVLATILIFIYVAGSLTPALWGTIAAASVLGQVALSLLELFVAFLQAYIFTFLTALFLGMALHPAH
ncbi:MAG TPA: F0F1 ATP synthase subunit A, partial [Gemmataceae bacterium]|nr:F0F1 ATP synthase subunit A [Gemmataceae bacterium]